jgi:glucose-1-phosphate thymidylyltransferase
MKGIILAGGKATRLYPVTKAVCKQLIPVYDKPMIYYPLSTLMLAGIKDILVISTLDALPRFQDLLGNGKGLGISISYAPQKSPRGIAESFIIGEEFIGRDSVSLILGDNIFYGDGLSHLLQEVGRKREGSTIFGYYVNDPQRYGVIEFTENCRIKAIIEKPRVPKSNYVVTGLYFYDNNVVRIAKTLKPSKRDELEVTDINNEYLRRKKLNVKLLGRGYAWLDMGTYDSLLEAATFIKTMQDRQGLMIGCIEEVAYRMGYIDKGELASLASHINTAYGEYLKRILKDEK